MQERIVEIILFLINELRSNKRLNDINVSLLTSDGYTQSEISSAFSWLFERISAGKSVVNVESGAAKSHRMLNDAEKMVFESQAYGYLIQCQQLSILNNVDVETIIERIMIAGFTTIGLPEIKSFVAGYLFDLDNSNALVLFNANDTIH